MKHSEEYERFTNLVDHLMSLPLEEMQRREAEYRKQADANLGHLPACHLF
jgi:hypothetical protein